MESIFIFTFMPVIRNFLATDTNANDFLGLNPICSFKKTRSFSEVHCSSFLVAIAHEGLLQIIMRARSLKNDIYNRILPFTDHYAENIHKRINTGETQNLSHIRGVKKSENKGEINKKTKNL